MKRKCVVLMAVLGILMSGCATGIPQEQYDSVVAEKESLKEEIQIAGDKSDTEEVEEISTDKKVSDEPQKVNLLESGWSSTTAGTYTNIYYAVKLENPNEKYTIEFPKIIITAKDENGKILKNEEQTLYSIAAGDTFTYGSNVSYEGAEAKEVIISVSNGKDNYANKDDTQFARSSDFTINNISENLGTMGRAYTGEITNNSGIDFSTVAVSIIYKLEGKIIGGEVGYVDDLNSGATKVFEVSSYSKMKYDSFEVSAIQW